MQPDRFHSPRLTEFGARNIRYGENGGGTGVVKGQHDWDAQRPLYLEWKARSGNGRHIEDGIDTFVFSGGEIRVQTVQYTVHER
jgi:hypothetical protein